MRRRLPDIILAVAFSLVLAGPAAVLACEAAGVELPSWASAEDARYLSGGSASSGLRASLSPEGFESGELQDAVEGEVEGRIPFKAAAMLADAAWQRGSIAAASPPFGYPCYPTFYGSSRLHVPSLDAVTYLPYKRSQGKVDALAALGRGMARAAGRNPQARFSLVLVSGYQEAAANPAYPLVSGAVDPAEYAAAVSEGAAGASNARVFAEGYGSVEDYYRDFFRSDHHWNWRGFSRAYNTVARELGLAPFESPGENAIEGYEFTGATARWGRDPVAERVSDTTYAFPGVEVDAPGGGRVAYNHDAFLSRTDPGKRYSFYDSYYQMPKAMYGPGEGRALVLSNSYGAGIAPYIAQNYAVTRFVNQFHPSMRDASARLQAMLDEGGYADVFLVANPTDLAGFMDACPDFFGE